MIHICVTLHAERFKNNKLKWYDSSLPGITWHLTFMYQLKGIIKSLWNINRINLWKQNKQARLCKLTFPLFPTLTETEPDWDWSLKLSSRVGAAGVGYQPDTHQVRCTANYQSVPDTAGCQDMFVAGGRRRRHGVISFWRTQSQLYLLKPRIWNSYSWDILYYECRIQTVEFRKGFYPNTFPQLSLKCLEQVIVWDNICRRPLDGSLWELILLLTMLKN